MEQNKMHSRLEIIYQLGKIVLGLLIFSFGLYMTICANIGLAPWDVLSMGISFHTPLSYGNALTMISIIILIIDILMKKMGLERF